ncbi:EF-hand domain-containing protein [Polynucleobacter acidiphobus]|uniref:calcium-binding protein n=1 Tax=Polynucleobacter acidiphobus TaxID=556053 RepID=UPI000D3AB067|nr:calcium-binding protein [Polynucleobacter acidiphobus]
MKKAAFSLIMLAALGTTFAQESRTDREIDERFAAADKNKDGKLTLEEAKAGMPRVAANFQRIDTQKKGYVTAAEIMAMADR